MKHIKTEIERGAASIIIKLSNGIIIVQHGTDKDILYERKVRVGTWEKLWKVLKDA